jgi:hypothetical protein
MREGTHAARRRLPNDFRRIGLAAAIADSDIRSTFGEEERRGGTDAARATGHQRALPT